MVCFAANYVSEKKLRVIFDYFQKSNTRYILNFLSPHQVGILFALAWRA